MSKFWGAVVLLSRRRWAMTALIWETGRSFSSAIPAETIADEAGAAGFFTVVDLEEFGFAVRMSMNKLLEYIDWVLNLFQKR